MNQHSLGADLLESSSMEKDLGVLMASKLSLSQQCVLVDKRVNGILGGDPAPLLSPGGTSSVLCPVLSSQAKRNMVLVQSKVMKMFKGLEHPFYEERLRELGLFTLEKRRLSRDLINSNTPEDICTARQSLFLSCDLCTFEAEARHSRCDGNDEELLKKVLTYWPRSSSWVIDIHSMKAWVS
ncbi:hypothetical protein WISP_64809 [Willisornis vidua]|uniref:Uncharacterized protein n=1 Tax=Willisornis vidua TaxID=1566151 RepID=A0ABQ9D9G2_9PASS|nr:hypothetical protein WISP_64809 [Willisornis vidua]